MRRRQFLICLAATATAWPLVAHAQPSERVRRVGVLMNLAENDPDAAPRVAAFRQALQALGWQVGRNLQIEYRWGAGDPALYRQYAEELVAMSPDAILANGGAIVRALLRVTSTVPIVFTNAVDPVAVGFVSSLARPGGNATGFTSIEYRFGGKWLELLKEIVPSVKRVVVLYDPSVTVGIEQFAALQMMAPKIGMELTPVDVRDLDKMEQAIAAFAQTPNGGLATTSSTWSTLHRGSIIAAAARHRLPAVYPNRFYVEMGGLVSYGPLFLEQYQRAANYVDRIFKGANPADLPVQTPTRYEMILNLKTAKDLGINIPRIVIFRADGVIE